jgi:hypothetical protein
MPMYVLSLFIRVEGFNTQELALARVEAQWCLPPILPTRKPIAPIPLSGILL